MTTQGIQLYSESFVQYVFYPVGRKNTQRMPVLREIFEQILTPLYGSQDEALRKIEVGTDRDCHLLYANETPVGVIAFKTLLSDEFAQIAPQRFVSGSKDSNIKEWDYNGNLVREHASGIYGYKYWVTALATFNNGNWACGTRDGFVVIWDRDGNKVRTIKYAPNAHSKQQYICKERNKERINCIEEYDSDKNTFYTGTPKFLQLWNANSGKMIRYHFASDNDWVYCIKPIEKRDLLVVIGSKLEFWNMQDPLIPQKTNVIREEKTTEPSRPHIASIVQLANQPHLWANACFDAKVRVVDIYEQKIVRYLEEHQRRVWSVINVNQNNFASSADDRTVKIWDMREQNSVLTLSKHPGRASSLLKLEDNFFISGSCPDNLRRSPEKARITFWDLRKVLN